MATAFPDVKPFPVPATAPAAIGHNRPPIEEQGVADFNDAIDAHEQNIRNRIAMLLDASTRAKAEDDDTCGRCAELVRQMNAVEAVIEEDRTSVKRPYLEAGRKIDEAAKTLVGELSAAKARVRGLAEGYMREKAAKAAAEQRRLEEEQRRAREVAEQAAREEAERAAAEGRDPNAFIMEAPLAVAAKPIEAAPTQVRSDLGAMASARKVKVAVITDYAKAFKAVKNVPAVQEAIQKAINGLVRAGQTAIPGVEIKDDIGLSIR